MLTRGYSGARAYCQSKLAQITFTIDLAAQAQAYDAEARRRLQALSLELTGLSAEAMAAP